MVFFWGFEGTQSAIFGTPKMTKMWSYVVIQSHIHGHMLWAERQKRKPASSLPAGSFLLSAPFYLHLHILVYRNNTFFSVSKRPLSYPSFHYLLVCPPHVVLLHLLHLKFHILVFNFLSGKFSNRFWTCLHQKFSLSLTK